MNRDPLVFIRHILENLEDIELFTKNVSRKDFFNNKEKQNAVVRSLEIIGEASKNLPLEFREKHKGIEWKEIIGTRDKIIHHYFGVDLEIIWDIIKINLPVLKKKLKVIVK